MLKRDFKIMSAVIIWVTTLIGSILPIWITAAKWTSRLEALAGGVFLGAGLAHLLADAGEELEHIDTEYPIGPATCLVTFCIFTAVELFSYGEHDAEFQVDGHDHGHGHGHSHGTDYDAIPDKVSLQSLSTDGTPVKKSIFGDSSSKMTIPTISLYIIMDVHSTIEGLALGVLNKWSGLIAIFCAIVGHKPVEAFALSLIILKDKPTKVLFWILVIFYTLCSPIGLVVGIFLDELDSPLTLGLIAAFSAGTFLFVGCHEWSEMFEHKQEWPLSEKLWHYGMFAIGVIWMLLIAIVEALGEGGEGSE